MVLVLVLRSYIQVRALGIVIGARRKLAFPGRLSRDRDLTHSKTSTVSHPTPFVASLIGAGKRLFGNEGGAGDLSGRVVIHQK